MDTIEKPKKESNTAIVALKKEVKAKLDKLKVHPRETYNDVIERAIAKEEKTIQDSETAPKIEEPQEEKIPPAF